jgi:hypothetical protein
MTIIDPILYANGALRLTRHGAGKGDTVLVLELGGSVRDQLEVADDLTEPLQSNLEGLLEDGRSPVSAFAALTRLYDPEVDSSAY